MALFNPDAKRQSPQHARIYAAYELVYTGVDFAASVLFLVGSILFFWEATTHFATWLFVVGSICFAAKPTVRLLREVAYWRAGKLETLARRAEREG